MEHFLYHPLQLLLQMIWVCVSSLKGFGQCHPSSRQAAKLQARMFPFFFVVVATLQTKWSNSSLSLNAHGHSSTDLLRLTLPMRPTGRHLIVNSITDHIICFELEREPRNKRS